MKKKSLLIGVWLFSDQDVIKQDTVFAFPEREYSWMPLINKLKILHKKNMFTKLSEYIA